MENQFLISEVLLVLSCCAIVTVRSGLPCLGAPEYLPFSFAAAPESCDAYIICMNGQTIRGERCPTGKLFEPVNQVCGQSSCMDCSPFGIQNLPHPDDCFQFIRCTMGTREITTCPSNLMFDRTIGNCNYPHLVQCPGQPTEPTEPPTYPTYPTDTTTEWPTFPTDPTDWPTYPTEPWPPIPTDPPPPVDFICSGRQIFFAHPHDCNRFFICVRDGDLAIEHRCPENLHWNQLLNACDTPENARCLVGPIIPTTSSIAPPITEPPLFPPTDAPWAAGDEQAVQISEN